MFWKRRKPVDLSQLPDLSVTPVTVHLLTEIPPGATSLGFVRGRQSLTAPVTAEDAEKLRQCLLNPATYDDEEGARCFLPGMALVFGTGDDAACVLLCLLCRWAVFSRAVGEEERWIGLSEAGLPELWDWYNRLAEPLDSASPGGLT